LTENWLIRNWESTIYPDNGWKENDNCPCFKLVPVADNIDAKAKLFDEGEREKLCEAYATQLIELAQICEESLVDIKKLTQP
jgi:hypothetical protein